MTRYITILLLTLLFYHLNGRCLNTFVSWPTKKINCNTILILEHGVGTYTKDGKQKITLDLIPKNGLLLKHGKDTIRLEIVLTFSNEFGFSQVVIKPKTNLKPNTKYRVVTYNDKKEIVFCDIGRKYWETNSVTDNSNPTFRKNPSFIEDKTCYNESFEHCYNALFKFKAKDQSKCVLKLKINNTNNGSTNELICLPNKNQILIGMSECYYGYEFKLGHEYEITFQLIDSSNNLSTEEHKIKYKPQK